MLARAAVLRGSAPLHDPDCLSSWQIKNEHSRPPDGLRGTCCEMPRTQQFLTVPTISEVAFSYYLARNSFHRGPESSSVCKLFTSSFPPRAWGRRTRRPGPARASPHGALRLRPRPRSAEGAGGGGYHGDSGCGSDWPRRPDPAPSVRSCRRGT